MLECSFVFEFQQNTKIQNFLQRISISQIFFIETFCHPCIASNATAAWQRRGALHLPRGTNGDYPHCRSNEPPRLRHHEAAPKVNRRLFAGILSIFLSNHALQTVKNS
jgi:hypothetical protein